MSPRSILFLSTGLERGGAETLLLRILERLDRRRFKPAVLALGGETAYAAELRARGEQLFCAGLSPANSWRALAIIRRAVKDTQPQLIQGWMYHGNLAAGFCGELLRVPYWFGVHNSLYNPALEKLHTRGVIRAGAWLSRRAAGVIYCGDQCRLQHEQLGYCRPKGVVISNGFDTERFRFDSQERSAVRAMLGIPDSAKVVGHISRFHPQKDPETFARALAIMQRRDSALHCIALGKGIAPGNAELQRLLEAAGVDPARVHLLGEQDRVERFLSAVDCLMQSACSEAFPLAPGEAMSCGRPCAATDVGDTRQLLGESGIVVPPGEPAQLADAALALLREEEPAAEQRRRAARARIEQKFSFQIMVERYQDCWEQSGL